MPDAENMVHLRATCWAALSTAFTGDHDGWSSWCNQSSITVPDTGDSAWLAQSLAGGYSSAYVSTTTPSSASCTHDDTDVRVFFFILCLWRGAVLFPCEYLPQSLHMAMVFCPSSSCFLLYPVSLAWCCIISLWVLTSVIAHLYCVMSIIIGNLLIIPSSSWKLTVPGVLGLTINWPFYSSPMGRRELFHSRAYLPVTHADVLVFVCVVSNHVNVTIASPCARGNLCTVFHLAQNVTARVESSMVVSYQWDKQPFYTPKHWHPEYQLEYQLSQLTRCHKLWLIDNYPMHENV